MLSEQNLQNKIAIAKDLEGLRQCRFCKQWIEKRGFDNHEKWCLENPQNADKKRELEEKKTRKYPCKWCGREWDSSKSRNGHQIRCKSNPNGAENAKRIGAKRKGIPHTEESKEKISSGMKETYQKGKEIASDGTVYAGVIVDNAGDEFTITISDGLD